VPRLRFPFRPLPGRRERLLRPLVPLEVRASGALFPFPLLGLVDTGAPFTLLPLDIAKHFGLRLGRGRRIGIVVAGWRGRTISVRGLVLRLGGPDLDRGGAEGIAEIHTEALLAPASVLPDFAILGQRGFLDQVDEACLREKERWIEIRMARPTGGVSQPPGGAPGAVRERSAQYRRRRLRV
jgi:hypothetical protein